MNIEYITDLQCMIGTKAAHFCSIMEVYMLKQSPISLEIERKAMYM